MTTSGVWWCSKRTRWAGPALHPLVAPHKRTSVPDKSPSDPNWIHEIKHDGFRLMARRDPVGIRLITRQGNDWSTRYPLVVEAVNHLKVRSCLIDGEVVCCDAQGVTSFQLLRHPAERAASVPLRFRPAGAERR
jgi:ATP-dependent DNA ligase